MNALQKQIQKFQRNLKLHQAYVECFSTPAGKMVLEHLMEEAGLLSLRKIIMNHDLLMLEQGKKHVVFSILRNIGRDKQELIKQIEESMKYENETITDA